MAFRVLTDIFVLMRNNSITNKNVFNNDQFSDDRTALVLNLETNSAQAYTNATSNQIPEWSNEVNQIQYEISKIKHKFKELSLLHDRHLNRPTLDDNLEEVTNMDMLTQHITNSLAQCQVQIRKISNKSTHTIAQNEQLLIRNVVNTLARSVQDLTIEFRRAQSVYLNKIKSREERSKFPLCMPQVDTSILMQDFDVFENDLRQDQDLLQKRQQNEVALQEREKEINSIVRSIQDLNDIFRDLATMIVDQGTVLDRIDCNIEKVTVHVQQGLSELQKASKYQKSDRKMKIIFVLSIIVIVLFIFLIIFKS